MFRLPIERQIITLNEQKFQPEVVLWQRVILQLFTDAQVPISDDIMQNKQRIEALTWLGVRDQDFKLVCDLADLNQYYVITNIELMLKYIVDKQSRGVGKNQNSFFIQKVYAKNLKHKGFRKGNVRRLNQDLSSIPVKKYAK